MSTNPNGTLGLWDFGTIGLSGVGNFETRRQWDFGFINFTVFRVLCSDHIVVSCVAVRLSHGLKSLATVEQQWFPHHLLLLTIFLPLFCSCQAGYSVHCQFHVLCTLLPA